MASIPIVTATVCRSHRSAHNDQKSTDNSTPVAALGGRTAKMAGNDASAHPGMGPGSMEPLPKDLCESNLKSRVVDQPGQPAAVLGDRTVRMADGDGPESTELMNPLPDGFYEYLGDTYMGLPNDKPPQELKEALEVVRNATKARREVIVADHTELGVGQRISILSRLLDRLRAVFCPGSPRRIRYGEARYVMKDLAIRDIEKKFYENGEPPQDPRPLQFALKHAEGFFATERKKGNILDADAIENELEYIISRARQYGELLPQYDSAYRAFKGNNVDSDTRVRLENIENGGDNSKEDLERLDKQYRAMRSIARFEADCFIANPAPTLDWRAEMAELFEICKFMHERICSSITAGKNRHVVDPDHPMPSPPPENPLK